MWKVFNYSVVSLILLLSLNIKAYAITPYHSVVREVSFGAIFGFPGVCTLDYLTSRVNNVSGSLCDHAGINFGTTGKIIIYGNPNTQISIRLKSKPNDGDGLTYSASGLYSVNGLPDVVIIADSPQLIDTGSTGNITITLGGTLTSTIQQSFGASYELTIVEGLEYTEQ
ncbi:MAG: hypothetical protein ACSHW0_02065 [Thalassotalea sp.]